MAECVVVTGATGFLGSHLIARLLSTFGDVTVLCVARSVGAVTAHQRVLQTVTAAWSTECDYDPRAAREAIAARLRVIDHGITEDSGPLAAEIRSASQCPSVSAFWHCAAMTNFVNPNEETLEAINIHGTVTAFRAASACGAERFNHVSTAYVAGRRQGDQPEALLFRHCDFNNKYEETKHVAEALVASMAEATGTPYRIFRPGVVIGNSRTYRAAKYSGIYDVIRVAESVGHRLHREASIGRRPATLRIAASRNATVHLVPVEIAVEEMMWHDAQGPSRLGSVVHVCSEDGTPVVELIEKLLPMCGVEDFSVGDECTPVSLADKLLEDRLLAFAPYIRNYKRFLRTVPAERRNTKLSAPVTSEAMLEYARVFIAQRESLVGSVGDRLSAGASS